MVKNEDYVPSVISANKSRAGVTGHHVRYVLAFGLAGVIIAFVVIGLYFYEHESDSELTRPRLSLTALRSPSRRSQRCFCLVYGIW